MTVPVAIRRFRKRPCLWLCFVVIICFYTLISVSLLLSSSSGDSGHSLGTAAQEQFLLDTLHDNYDFHEQEVWPFRSIKDWCHSASANQRENPGLIYVKVPKTGSSTLAGINIRLARGVGRRKVAEDQKKSLIRWLFSPKGDTSCSFTYQHGREALEERFYRTNSSSSSLGISPSLEKQMIMPNRSGQEYLLWSFVRDPAARSLSEFAHFQIARQGVETIKPMYLARSKNFQTNYLRTDSGGRTKPYHPGQSITPPTPNILQDQILSSYDFVGVLERKAESLAVMTLLWDIPVTDVLVLSSKLSGGYDDGRWGETCYRIPRLGPLDEKMQLYMQTGFHDNNVDYELHRLVSEKLDRTIDSLGRHRVAGVVQQLQELQTLIEDNCRGQAIFPCSQNGTRQHSDDCYWGDSGCGFRCVDQVLMNHELARPHSRL